MVIVFFILDYGIVIRTINLIRASSATFSGKWNTLFKILGILQSYVIYKDVIIRIIRQCHFWYPIDYSYFRNWIQNHVINFWYYLLIELDLLYIQSVFHTEINNSNTHSDVLFCSNNRTCVEILYIKIAKYNMKHWQLLHSLI